MADTHEAGQVEDALSVLEDVAGHAVALALISVEGRVSGLLPLLTQNLRLG